MNCYFRLISIIINLIAIYFLISGVGEWVTVFIVGLVSLAGFADGKTSN